VGLPLVELSDILGELPKGMAAYLVKLLADMLIKKKDYAGAVRLWETRLELQKDDLNVLIELSQTLLLSGDRSGARQCLAQAQALSPQNAEVLVLLKQVEAVH
jgi:uncharacterized protein HemY